MRRLHRLPTLSLALAALLTALVLTAAPIPAQAAATDEVHYTYTGPTSVAFDWRGSSNQIQYGLTASYGSTVLAATPNPGPISSTGPFWEAKLIGLNPGTTYH